MMLSILAALSITTLQPTPGATTAQPSPAQAQVQAAGMAFGQCIEGAMTSLAPTATPEAGAASALATCGTQKTALVSAVEAMIATMPADQQAAARAQLATRTADSAIQAQIAEGIRQARAGGAPSQ